MILKGLPIIQVRKILLATAQKHVNTLGWSQKAITLAAQEHQFPIPIANRVFKPADLIEFTMDGWSHKLQDESKQLELPVGLKARLATLVRKRLEYEVPFLPKWHEAMQLGVSSATSTFLTAYKLLGHLEQIWRIAGEKEKDVIPRQMGWYGKQAALTQIFTSVELSLLKDTSENYANSWKLLEQEIDSNYSVLSDSSAAVNIT